MDSRIVNTIQDVQIVKQTMVDVDQLKATNAEIESVYADYAAVRELIADKASIGDLQAVNAEFDRAIAKKLEADDLKAVNAEIDNLKAKDAEFDSAIAKKLEADDLKAVNAEIDNLKANSATVTQLNAAEARVGTLLADKASAAELDAAKGRISELESDHVSTTDLEAEQARVGTLLADYTKTAELDATYAKIDLANVTNAWMENGVIKDAAISDAQIIGVSANKMTTGTLDASKVDVTNLNAKNINVEKINGVKVTGKSVADALAAAEGEIDGLSEDISDLDSKYAGYVADLNARVDAQIETWTAKAVPTLNNYPASSWNTAKLRDEHVGDICYVVNAGNEADGYTYRFAYDDTSSSYGWVLIKDNQVTKALQDLLTAQGDISNLQDFQSETSHWIDETDEGITEVRMQHNELKTVVDKTVKASTQLWHTKNGTALPTAPKAKVTDTSTAGDAWRAVVPAYSASYPNYFYCWQYEYADGTFGWSAVVRDVAMEESQSTARTAASDASTAKSNASTAKSTADSKARNFTSQPKPPYSVGDTWTEGSAGDVKVCKTARASGSYTASDWVLASKYTDDTKADAAASAASAADTKATNAATAAATADGKAVSAQNTANANIKSSVMLWYTSDSATPPDKPYADDSTSYISSTSTAAKAWTTVVPTYAAATPNYHYCYQQQRGDGKYQWTAPVYDQATSEAMKKAQAALPASTFQTFQSDTFKKVVDEVNESSTTITNLTESVKYGGRNLLQGTADPQVDTVGNPPCWLIGSGGNGTGTIADVTDSPVPGVSKSFRITGNTSGNRDWQQKVTDLFNDWDGSTWRGGEWMFSAYVRAIGAECTAMLRAWGSARNWNKTFKVGTDWTRVEYPVTLSGAAPNIGYVRMLIGLTDAGSIEYIAPKLERGPFATPWDYAAEDVTSMSNTVNEVKQTATENKASIESLSKTVTANETDIEKKYSTLSQTLDGLSSTVGATIEESVTGPNLLTGNALNPNSWTISAPAGAGYAKAAYGTAGTKVSFATVSGYENLYSPAIAVTSGHTYTLTVEYTVGKEYTISNVAKPGYGLGVYRGTAFPGSSYDGSLASFLGKALFIQSATSKAWTATCTFTATSDSIVLMLNGGMIADSQTGLSFTLDKLKLVENVSSRLSIAETAIEQSKEAIALRATKTEAYQSAQPNLSPYFSATPYSTADNPYWKQVQDGSGYTFTEMGDGWMRVQCTNGGTSVLRKDWYPVKCPTVKAGEPYTWLVEIRNNKSTSVSASSDCYLVQTDNLQFWGQKAIQTVEGPTGAGVAANVGTCGETYTARKVQKAETASDGHWRNNSAENVIGLACWVFRCAAGCSIDYEVRISLYECTKDANGNVIPYSGPYKPYSGSQLYASQAELKVESDRISARVEKNGVIAAINASVEKDGTSAAKISADKVNIEGAAIFTSGKLSKVVTTTQTEWYSSTSATSKAGGSWGTTQPSVVAGRFIWERQKVTYSDGTSEYKPSAEGVCTQGQSLAERRCLVGQSGSTNTNPWYKFASISMTGAYQDRYIVFDVTCTYGFHGTGQLRASVRQGTGGATLDVKKLEWVSRNSYIQPAKFVMAYKANAAGNGFDIDLWAKIDSAYLFYRFDVVQEGDRTTLNSAPLWTLYDKSSAGSEAGIPDGYTQVVSTDADAAQITANAAAPKTSAIAREQRIWYRQTAIGAAPGKNQTWLSTSGTGYGNWSLTVPPLTSGSTKYPKLYTAVQSQTVAQQAAGSACTCTQPLLDDSTTVIDGGNIITGSVAANRIDAASGTFAVANIPDLSAAKITSGYISADRIQAGSLTLGHMDGLEDALGAIDDELDAKAGTADVEGLTGDLKQLGDDMDARFKDIGEDIERAGRANQYVHFEEDVGLMLGESGSDVTHVLTNSRDSFRYKGEEVAAVGVDDDGTGALVIANASVSDKIGFGKFAWVVRNGGQNVSFKWNGE